jgi:hypothetical protein
MHDTLTEDGARALFSNPAAPGFVLWFRPRGRRRGWEMVGLSPTHQAAVQLIGTAGRRGGDWLILPSGKQP